jgi:hypothetical protein
MATSPSTVGSSVLRLVLFGQSGGGKSSLLEALTQAAQEQDASVGTVVDLGGGELPNLEDVTAVTARQEVQPSLVTFRPEDGAPPLNALLLDSVSQAAGKLLADNLALAAKSLPGTLADAIAHADGLILTIDVAVPPARLEAEFNTFARFLKTLEEVRGDRVEVGGLPVFLVLTRCDLLAKPNDTLVDWLERIEQRKRDLDTRFRAVLDQDNNHEDGGFGDLELHLWATAARRPALGGKPAPAGESYGVSELFRLCLERAAAYREQRIRSARLLRWVVGVSGVVLIALLGMISAAVVSAGHQQGPVALTPEQRHEAELRRTVAALRALDKETPERLQRPWQELENRRALLEEVRRDNAFQALTQEDREFVENRARELRDYLEMRYYLLRTNPLGSGSEAGLRELRTDLVGTMDRAVLDELREHGKGEAELEELRKKVADRDRVPGKWKGTEVGRTYNESVSMADALQEATVKARLWFDTNRDKAVKLLAFGDATWTEWHEESGKLLEPGSRGSDQQRRPQPSDSVEGIPREKRVTMKPILNFPEVKRAIRDYEETRLRLERLRQIGVALHLARRERNALLTFEDGFGLSDAARRYQAVADAYPFLVDPKFSLTDLGAGERACSLIRNAAQEQYALLLGLARPAVLAHYQAFDTKTQTESRVRWKDMADWLRDNKDDKARQVNACSDLAGILLRLMEPGGIAPPSNDLIAFLDRDEFELQFNRLELEIPAGSDVRPDSDAKLRIIHDSPSGQVVWEFNRVSEQPDPRDRVIRYVYKRVKPDTLNARMDYHPGEGLRAELDLPKGPKLIWKKNSTTSYQFEALSRQPVRDTTEQSNIRLRALDPEKNGLPRVPDLLRDLLPK